MLKILPTWLFLMYAAYVKYCATPADAVTSDHLGNRQRIWVDGEPANSSRSTMCGVRDPHYHPEHYVLGPSKWNKTQLSFRIVNFPANLSELEVREAISNAFYVWSDVSRLTFQEIRSGHADILIQFLTGIHDDGYPFDGPGKIVAHAFYPADARGGNVHFDADETWTVTATEGLNLFMVAAHEIGHALGLAHSNVTGALMSRWHREFVTDFVLPDDDVLAIQQLYGASETTSRRVFLAPTAPSSPPAASTVTDDVITTVTGDVTASTTANYPDPCSTSLDAISVIRGQLVAFKSNWFWRLGPTGETYHSEAIGQPSPRPLKDFWFGMPPELEKVDAVFERPSDGRIFIFSGERYWELSGRRVLRRFGQPLSRLGLPRHVTRVDAAFVWGHHRRTYLVTGRTYWRLDKSGRSVLLHGYPRDVTGVWAGVKLPIDAAFTHTDGKSYFFSGELYWQFNDARMRVQRGYPRPIGERWFGCPRRQASSGRDHVTSRSSLQPRLSAIAITLLFTVLNIA